MQYKPINLTLSPYDVAVIYEGLNQLLEDKDSAEDAAGLKRRIEAEFKRQNGIA